MWLVLLLMSLFIYSFWKVASFMYPITSPNHFENKTTDKIKNTVTKSRAAVVIGSKSPYPIDNIDTILTGNYSKYH